MKCECPRSRLRIMLGAAICADQGVRTGYTVSVCAHAMDDLHIEMMRLVSQNDPEAWPQRWGPVAYESPAGVVLVVMNPAQHIDA